MKIKVSQQIYISIPVQASRNTPPNNTIESFVSLVHNTVLHHTKLHVFLKKSDALVF
jgi:hypothetical protein